MSDPIAGLASTGGAGAPPVQSAGGNAPVAPPDSPPTPVQAPLQAAPPPDLHQLAAELNQYVQQQQTNLHFQVDQTTGQMVISVIDTQTNQVLMQVPDEAALAVAQSLARMQAQLVKHTA